MVGKIVFDGSMKEFLEFVAGLPEEEARRLRKLLKKDKVEFLREIPEGATLEEPEWSWFVRENEGVDGEYSRDGKYLYRLATTNDLSREDLIHREATALSRATGLLYREARKIIDLFIALGWEARIWRNLMEDRKGLFYWVQIAESELEREKYLDASRKREVPLIETRNGEKSDSSEELDEDELDYNDHFDDLWYGLSEEGELRDYITYKVWQNWTGEIRLPTRGEEPRDDGNESEDSGGDSEIGRLIKSVVTVFSGRKAYEISNKVKEWLKANERNGIYQRYKRSLKRAWDIRRQLPSDAPLEERIKASRNVW